MHPPSIDLERKHIETIFRKKKKKKRECKSYQSGA